MAYCSAPAAATQESVRMYAELRELREGQQVLLREVTLQQQLEAQYSQRAALQAGFSSF